MLFHLISAQTSAKAGDLNLPTVETTNNSRLLGENVLSSMPSLSKEAVSENRLAQVGTAVITDVELTVTTVGLRIILVSDQPLSDGVSRTVENALIIEIPNATLELADPSVVTQFTPAEGIALFQISSQPDGNVELIITGTDALPVAEISADERNLVFDVSPGIATTASPGEEAIQVVVTATRTE
ncbi:MAG: hypothetical protein F6K30_13230, partial [Cyanothece sp. SIO2G6]|nr:hypothetical protein [Cyanothece sp. SIO2G6]